MGYLLRFTLFAVLTLGIGLGSSWRALQGGMPGVSVTAGPWVMWPREGTSDMDPYTLARVSQLGLAPINATSVIPLTAMTDSKGRALTGNCSYEVRGVPIPGVWWGFGVYRSDGTRLQPPRGRTAINSGTVATFPDGRFVIRVSPTVQAGNWLASLSGEQLAFRFELVRPLNPGAWLSGQSNAFPVVERMGCDA
jgi:hypothetical protein